MKIKKFKNGKIKLEIEKFYDIADSGEINENVYHDDMFFSDLYIDTIDGSYIIADYNTSIVYDYFSSYLIQNPLKSLLDDLQTEKIIYLYPSDINILEIDSMQENV